MGIGASAGGLEAFSQLLKHLPADTGFGFVLVQHLDPQHASALSEILARTTTMPVREVTNNLRVEANNVYIIPPNTSLGISRGVLKLLPRSKSRVSPRSIDFFFEALATDQGERAIGVILSGNATDGTLGLEAIKAEGGFTIVQDDSARYDSMPKSAVAAGCVDLVLSPDSIAAELARIAKHPYVATRASRFLPAREIASRSDDSRIVSAVMPRSRGDSRTSSKGDLSGNSGPDGKTKVDPAQSGYTDILLSLRSHSGVDFSLYKPSTVRRRIARRSVLNRMPTLEAYAKFLRGNVKELDALYADTLINVTSFFRNGEVFTALKQRVFPSLLAEKDDEPIRVWVLGCSTGQEAYSIAMAFAELAERAPRPRKLQIFATDLNEANLGKARAGFYPKTLAQDVSPERLRRFFVEEENGYRVIKKLRESIVFARQNVISDPPFSRMDLISCRNVMIYLEAVLQRKIIPTFHYALKKGGFLLLGASESVGGFHDLFTEIGKRQKIFVKKVAPTQAFHLPVKKVSAQVHRSKASRSPLASAKRSAAASDAFASELNAEREADRVTINQFAPAGVLINGELQVLQFRGRTGAYLEARTGKATFNLLRMAREGLMLPLRAAISSAKKSGKTVRRENVMVKYNGRTRAVNVEVVPLTNLRDLCFLVLFEEAATKDGRRDELVDAGPEAVEAAQEDQKGIREDSERIVDLEKDLSETRDYLHSMEERQEAAKEELQATNEEGQSANEELQSLNEELETSKEELESTNEELTTVNEEMVSRNRELSHLIEERKKDELALRASDERFRALFDLGPVGVYSCDASGRIQEYNKCAVDLWGRKPKTGDNAEKFCGSFKMFKTDGAYMPHAQCPMAQVLKGKIASARDLECVIERPDGSRITVIVNIVALKDAQNETTGAINCFYNITERKSNEVALREAQVMLTRHADQLEGLVLKRTSQLTTKNAQLVESAHSVEEGHQRYKALFADSLVMQEKLRHLTRLIITAQEEERKKISRELHDEVVQTLIGINIELTALGKRKPFDDAALRKKITNTQRLVQNSVIAVHRFARGLRPAVLDDLGLIPALHAYCKAMTAKKHLKIRITAFGGVEALDSQGRTVLFRVAQEALSNIDRHAHASQVSIHIVKVGESIRMEIHDDGKSFPVEKLFKNENPKRLGLIGMKERIEMIGGVLTIESAAGKGTTVRAEIPFPPPPIKKET